MKKLMPCAEFQRRVRLSFMIVIGLIGFTFTVAMLTILAVRNKMEQEQPAIFSDKTILIDRSPSIRFISEENYDPWPLISIEFSVTTGLTINGNGDICL